MAFFNEPTPALATHTPTPADRARANTLYTCLTANRRITTRPNLTAWATAFRQLRANRTEAEIDATLNWYIAHATDPYVPTIHSAKGFLAKYPAIEDAMLRGSTPLPTTISPAAHELAQRAGGLHWPGGEEDKTQELQFIQAALDRWEEFRACLYRCQQRYPADRNFYEYMRLGLACPKTMALQWLMDTHHYAWDAARAGRWEPGRLLRYGLRLDHWRIKKLLEEAIVYWGGNRTYKSMMEQVDACRTP